VNELVRRDEGDQTTKLDAAIANAWTRSGTFALLLSSVLVSLVPYWSQGRKDAYLGRYIAIRLNVAVAIDQLDDDSLWQKYKSSNEAAESMSMEELLKVQLGTTPSTPNANEAPPAPSGLPETTPSTSNPNKVQQNLPAGVPGAPTGLHFIAPIDEIHEVAKLLPKLDDAELLSISRKASDFYNYSIYRWALKRLRLVAQANPGIVFMGSTDEQAASEYAVPPVGYELLKKLTLRDIRELAHFELPKIQEDVKPGGQHGQDIEIIPGLRPRNLYMASLFAEVLLLYVVMYFYAFTREAILSGAFPGRGTLLSAFSSSRLTLVVFLVALCTPALACWGVAAASRKLSLTALSAFNSFAVGIVYVALQRKSYFKRLWRR